MVHQTEEQLECYALGRLPEAQVAVVEEHLLICDVCQHKLDEVEAFALAMREAIATAPAPRPRTDWLAWLRPENRLPSWSKAAAGGFAVFVFAAGLYMYNGRTALAPTATLQLTAIRGEMPSVPPARETDIILSDAPAHPGLRVEVVDSTGTMVWSGPFHSDTSKMHLVRQLSEGSHFIRLYDSGGKLLREYGFVVRASL
jgi:hypothetical protein